MCVCLYDWLSVYMYVSMFATDAADVVLVVVDADSDDYDDDDDDDICIFICFKDCSRFHQPCLVLFKKG